MDATLALMREGGLSACSAPEIARRAGVAVGTIYRRFADKDQLIGAAIFDFISLQGGAQESQYRSMATDASDLRDFLRRYILFAIKVGRDEARFLQAVRDYLRSVDDAGWLNAYHAHVGNGRLAVLDGAMDRFPFLRQRQLDFSIALASIHGAINACLVDPASGFAVAIEKADELTDPLVRMVGDFLETERRMTGVEEL